MRVRHLVLFPCRAGMLLLALAVPALAQFADLATTDDGSQLYFTSTMKLKDAGPSARTASRLYRYSLSRVSLYAEPSSGGLGYVSVSGDGSVIGYTVQDTCSGEGCDTDHAVVRGASAGDLGPGVVQISRNGRWALVYLERTNCTGMMCSTEYSATLVDLLDGRRIATPATVIRDSWMRSLTSDGGVLGVQPGNLIGIGGAALPVVGVWKDGRFTPVPLPPGRAFYPAAVSDDGRAVIVSEAYGDAYPIQTRLLAASTATGLSATIAESRDGAYPSLLSVSNDGRRVLYAMLGGSNGRAYLWDAAIARSIPVPLNPDESATDGVLSGDGRIAFVATTRARIVRFTIDLNVAASLFPPPPYCDDPGWVALGSLTRLHCSLTGSVDALQGKILHGAIAVPVVSSNAGEIDIQIPWESEYNSRLSYDVPTDSPFRGSQSVYAEQGAPEILPDSHGLFGMRAARGDWSGPLTSLPASGEIFHVYMTGLGPVQAWQTTGVPAPRDQAVPIYWRLDCALRPGVQPVETLFAGIAPGLLGVYQTTFRMPAIPARGAQPDGFRCFLVSDTTAVGFSPGDPRQPICGEGCATGPVPTRDPPR